MGFCCGPSDVRVLPKNTSYSPSPPPSINGKKKQPQRQGKQQGVKSEEVKEKKRSNLDRAALTTPQFPFHSRPGLM
ncbi:uncharacterized protein LOC124658914 [Lolium rigidum]|uniref:uncharacterized protein LOC124658914 n=1 Tax=Lolium rigidum TaxID=89674 RepID=UPI001F5D66B1|nr:uncharacterized protein LOC124658914 [Lolium rigidum]